VTGSVTPRTALAAKARRMVLLVRGTHSTASVAVLLGTTVGTAGTLSASTGTALALLWCSTHGTKI